MRTLKPCSLLIALAWLCGSPTAVWAERWVVVPGEGTKVVFASRAALEKFEGRTGEVTGWLDADLADLGANLSLEVQVDLATFDTGKEKRNQHMRENHLETERFPVAVFSGGTLRELNTRSLAIGGRLDAVLAGSLDLHGHVRETSCELTVTRPALDDLRVTARFAVLLPDHAIERPQFLIMKLAEDQQVTATLVLTREK